MDPPAPPVDFQKLDVTDEVLSPGGDRLNQGNKLPTTPTTNRGTTPVGGSFGAAGSTQGTPGYFQSAFDITSRNLQCPQALSEKLCPL